MKEYLRELILRHRSPGVIVDANLLLLLLVGDLSPARVEQFKPTRSHFVAADYVRLKELLTGLDRLVVTPHILTEVSNFLGKASSQEGTYALRSHLAESIGRFDIQDVPIAALVSAGDDKQIFCTLGLTDAGIIHLARKGYLAITVDFPLTKYIESLHLEAFNYTTASVLNIPPAKWGR